MCVDRLGLMIWQNGGGKGRRPEPISPITQQTQQGHRTKPDASLTQDQILDRLLAIGPQPKEHDG